MLMTCPTIPDLLAEDEGFPAPRIASFLYFPLAVEIGACYVEAMDMAWYHAGYEKDCVEDAVHSWTGDEHY